MLVFKKNVIIYESSERLDDGLRIIQDCSISHEYKDGKGWIMLDESIDFICDFAFSGSAITSIVIPEAITEIDSWAFENCANLIKVSLPHHLKAIRGNAFTNCVSLSSIFIPGCVNEISDNPFIGCLNLKSIVVDPSNKVYDSRNGCNAVIESESNVLVVGCNDTVIPESVIEIGFCAFSHAANLSSIVLPKSVQIIGPHAFSNSGLESLVIPPYVTEISRGAFDECSKLASIDLPRSLEVIDNDAFRKCESLVSIHIPESVSKIVFNPFIGCINLKSIVVDPSNKVYDSRNECNAVIESESDVLVVGCNDTVIPESVIEIGYCAFENLSNLYSVSIPSGVKTIDTGAFRRSGVSAVILPNGLEQIRYDAFSSCLNLESITIPDTVFELEGAFGDCERLKSIVLSKSLKKIRVGVFAGCSSIESIIIPDSVTHIEYSAFRGCKKLTAVTLPSMLEFIGERAFEDCSNLSRITIPDSVTEIQSCAFGGCKNLKTVDISGAKEISTDAFIDCIALSQESVTMIALCSYGLSSIKELNSNFIDTEEYIEFKKPIAGILMVQKVVEKDLTWEKAEDFASNLKLGGYDDWIIPYAKDLRLLQSIKDACGLGLIDGFLWSSSEYHQPWGDWGAKAISKLLVNFGDGKIKEQYYSNRIPQYDSDFNFIEIEESREDPDAKWDLLCIRVVDSGELYPKANEDSVTRKEHDFSKCHSDYSGDYYIDYCDR